MLFLAPTAGRPVRPAHGTRFSAAVRREDIAPSTPGRKVRTRNPPIAVARINDGRASAKQPRSVDKRLLSEVALSGDCMEVQYEATAIETRSGARRAGRPVSAGHDRGCEPNGGQR